MHIRYATLNDLDSIMEIYQYARSYMALTGNPNQWAEGYPARITLEQDIEKKQLFVCEDSEELLAVFAFILGPDPTYSYIEDGNWINDRPYGTIHRIAKKGTHRGIFEYCLRFCQAQISDIRIDTHHDNRIMQHLIKKHGFKQCGIIYLSNGSPRIAYHYSRQ